MASLSATAWQRAKSCLFKKNTILQENKHAKIERFCLLFKNSLIIHEENTKKNHKRVVSLYVDKDFPSFT
jgi:hypothetical protein